MQPHTIVAYDAELKELDALISEMAGDAQSALDDAAKALFAGDIRLAQQVIAGDAAIDSLQHKVEEKATSTVARRQRVAIDLRQIVSGIRNRQRPGAHRRPCQECGQARCCPRQAAGLHQGGHQPRPASRTRARRLDRATNWLATGTQSKVSR